MHVTVFEIMKNWPWWLWFLIGYVMAFLMVNWLLSWHMQEINQDRQRLTMLVSTLRDELKQNIEREQRLTRDYWEST